MSLYCSCWAHKQEWDEVHIVLQTSWYGCGEKQAGLQLIKPSRLYGSKKNTITDLETICSQFNFIMLINEKALLTAMGLKKSSWQKETRTFNPREWR